MVMCKLLLRPVTNHYLNDTERSETELCFGVRETLI
jgi:hypothetical protein